MIEKMGYDKVKYDHHYEKGEAERRDMIRGWEPNMSIMPMPMGEKEGSFEIPRNNVRERL